MFPTPPIHEEEPRDKCPGCVAMFDCDAHRRAREEARDTAAAQWAKVAPLIERLREAMAAWDAADKVSMGRARLGTYDAAAKLLAATEATP